MTFVTQFNYFKKSINSVKKLLIICRFCAKYEFLFVS